MCVVGVLLNLEKNCAKLVGLKVFRQLPIVEIIVEETITTVEFELLEELGVCHDVQGVEHVELFLLSENKRIVHQLGQ